MRVEQMNDLIDIDNNSLNIEYINILLSNKEEFKLAKKSHKPNFYSTILQVITHETYEEKEAKRLFVNIKKHNKKLNKLLKRDVGIVVATADYLSNIENVMDAPIIIEEEKSAFITENSTIDDLTQLYLREIFEVFLDKAVNETKRKKNKLSFLMIDIDDFKKVNDTYGHQKGDEVLTTLGAIFNNNIRAMDFAARYGGEEFSIVMPETSIKEASKIANRIRKIVSHTDFTGINITISIGISTLNKTIQSSKELIQYADKALYEAKESGKNKVMTKIN
ncbi:MAG: GGDEF domain-containing protein [Arcobacteraceae bacterium]